MGAAPSIVPDPEEYTLVIGGSSEEHSQRLVCFVNDANDLTNCDQSGDNCSRGCLFTIRSVESSSSNQLSIEPIDEDYWIDIGQSEWVDIDLTPSQASLSSDQEVSILLLYPSSSQTVFQEREVAVVTVIAQ